MFKTLGPSVIGIHGLSLVKSVELAQKTGFEGVTFNIVEAAELADAHGVDFVRGTFERAGIRPGSWGLPVAWRDDERWEQDLSELPRLAKLARELECNRTTTWCPPGSDEREFKENFSWHVARYRQIAETLARFDCRLGLEFVGPKTFRARFAHPFIYNLAGMMDLFAAIGTGNVGLLFDAYHLYTSGDDASALDRLTSKDIVLVHVNDAPAGVALEDQLDDVRRLPMETGVIDLPSIMRKLSGIGYDGPVMPEPFSARINAVAREDPERAARLTAEAMGRLWRACDLG